MSKSKPSARRASLRVAADRCSYNSNLSNTKTNPAMRNMSFPATIIIRHRKENPKKCSVIPLKGRTDIHFFGYPGSKPTSLDGYVRLAAEGPPLSDADHAAGILLLDGSWRAADGMTREYAHVPPRSLAGWVTAYPRVSRLGTDPANGLASVEALYLAYHILGRPTAGLLDHYHWAAAFLELNGLPKTHTPNALK